MNNLELIDNFRAFIWHFYQQNGRTFMWRNIEDPYKVVVSEIMLQQTQTYRVEPKYEQFIAAFPTFHALASATKHDVLSAWQGLGYNRRGAYLHQIAQKVMAEYKGQLPDNPDILVTFPGIGPATASSICAFAFNRPTIFIETNIRAVFIHSFFKDQETVTDKELMPLIEACVDQENPREWYYALMDYGVYLKANTTNPSRKSAHYARQSKFEGSDRQIRGQIIRALTRQNHLELDALKNEINPVDERFERALQQLIGEKLINVHNGIISI